MRFLKPYTRFVCSNIAMTFKALLYKQGRNQGG